MITYTYYDVQTYKIISYTELSEGGRNLTVAKRILNGTETLMRIPMYRLSQCGNHGFKPMRLILELLYIQRT